MYKFGTFEEPTINTSRIVKLFYPQRRFDYEDAFRTLDMTNLGATMRGTKEGNENVSVENLAYLAWNGGLPGTGFLVFLDLNVGDLVGFNLGISESLAPGDKRCDLCLVQQVARRVVPITFSHRSNTTSTITHYMCRNLNCSAMAVGKIVPEITTGYTEYPPKPEQIIQREENISKVLHDISARLIN